MKEKRQLSALVAVACSVTVLLACRHSSPVPPSGVVAATADLNALQPADSLPRIEWLPDGTAVLVDDRMLLSVTDGRVQALPLENGLSLPAFSSRPTRLAVVVKGALWVGKPMSPFPEQSWSLPFAGRDDHRATVGWLDAQRLLIVDVRPSAAADLCYTFDIATGRAARSPCLDAEFAHVARLEAVAPGWFAVNSGGEGSESLGFVRYPPLDGEKRSSLPPIPLLHADAVRATARDGGTIALVTACPLAWPPHEACDVQSRAPWRLYALALRAEAAPRLVRDDLPPGAVPEPNGPRFAWPSGHDICIGVPGSAKPRCFAYPRAP